MYSPACVTKAFKVARSIDIPGRNGRVEVNDFFFNQVRFIEIESREEHDRTPEFGRDIDGGMAGSAGDTGYVERAAIPGGGISEGGQGRSRVGPDGRVDSQCLKDRSINYGSELPARQ